MMIDPESPIRNIRLLYLPATWTFRSLLLRAELLLEGVNAGGLNNYKSVLLLKRIDHSGTKKYFRETLTVLKASRML